MESMGRVAAVSINRRDTFFDSVKTVLIYLVVFVHCLIRLGGGKKS